ncbi:MAG: hypothetical protein JAZ02_08115 [Candidatus Thiodiazotropha endolucinida]|nr:hypothetical protein [Candidatus Thiodiazotropha endolucinida]
MSSDNAAIIQNTAEVSEALSAIGLSKEIVAKVARAAASARAECLPVDPVNAPGSSAYHHGVRHIRLGLLPIDGWRMNRDENIESTENDELGVQVCFQNVLFACDPVRNPQAISRKGKGAKKLVASGQGELFDIPQEVQATRYGCTPAVWIICVEATDDFLRAEVSCPKVFEGAQFEGFHKRIFVVDENYDDWVPSDDDDSDLTEIDVPVSKK